MTTFFMLPDDLLFNCLSRVSRLYYPTLSLVSKKFRSLLASKEHYQTRTLLGRTEACLYVCFWLRYDPSPLRCFTLGLGPHSSKKVLVPISSPNFPSPNCQPTPNKSNFVVVGPNIYTVGGLIHLGDNESTASSRVMVMDCYSHEWRDAPSMLVPRAGHTSCVLDGKLYVTGGCKDLDSTNWMEVFDTKTQTWEFFKIPSEDLCKGSEYKSAGYEGTLYVRSKEKDATYKLNKGRWRAADLAMNYGWGRTSSYCVIENVFCRYGSRRIDWYDSVNRVWTALKGLELFPKVASTAKLTAYGGKLMILWQENGCEIRVWCSEIAIEKRQNGEIWGTLECSDVVFTTNEPYCLTHVLATTI